MKQKYTLNIADLQLSIISDAPAEEVQKLSGILDRKMREIYLKSRCPKTEAALLCALEAVADRAVERNIGARGLRAVMDGILTQIMFDIPSDRTITKVIITAECARGEAEPQLLRVKKEECEAEDGTEKEDADSVS